MLNRTTLLASALLVSGLAVAAQRTNLKLMPGTIGSGATAKWEVFKEGGNRADHRLVLHKTVPTSDNEAAGVDVSGIAGTLARDLNELCWTLEEGNDAGGSPRWNIYTGPSGGGITHVTFLSSPGEDGCFTDAEIEAALTAAGANLGDEIKYLQIIVDEQERIVLDDIRIRVGENSFTFGSPGQSGKGKIRNERPRRR
jgi:hypothetical protein